MIKKDDFKKDWTNNLLTSQYICKKYCASLPTLRRIAKKLNLSNRSKGAKRKIFIFEEGVKNDK